MKIVEPKTPYEQNDSDLMEVDPDDGGEDSMQIQQHLTEAEANAQQNAAHLGNVDMEAVAQQLQRDKEMFLRDEDDDDDEEERLKREEFRRKRKAHYQGEFNMAKALKRKYGT